MDELLLDAQKVSIDFHQGNQWVRVVDQVSFTLNRGEILAIVGESGCGKSVSAMSLTRLLPEKIARMEGDVFLNVEKKSVNLCQQNEKELQKIRGRHIAYIFQDPGVCLNPVLKIKDQLEEVFLLHRPEVMHHTYEAQKLLESVGIPEPQKRLNAYPHQLSGGMQQRVMIAMALAAQPALLIADEPTTALDVTVQAQVLKLMATLKTEHAMSVLLITHNFGLVSTLADRVAVMYAGEIIERGTRDDLLNHPAHPYTRALIRAVPEIGDDAAHLEMIPGRVPTPEQWSCGCRFQNRCQHAQTLDSEAQKKCCISPSEIKLSESHYVKCCYPILRHNAGVC